MKKAMALAAVFFLFNAQWAFSSEWDEAQAAYEKEDFEAAYALFEQLALQGEARAQFQLAQADELPRKYLKQAEE